MKTPIRITANGMSGFAVFLNTGPTEAFALVTFLVDTPIPRVGEAIRLSKIAYNVLSVVHDYDSQMVAVIVEYR